MKCFIYSIIIFLLTGCNLSQTGQFDLIITDTTLIDGTGAPGQTGISVGIKEGKIAAIGSSLDQTHAQVIDGTGKFLIPGLFDAHVHTNDYEKDFPSFIHYGVTSILMTGGSLNTHEQHALMREQGLQDSIPAPYLFHTSQHFSMEGRHPSKTYPSSNWRDGETIYFLRDTLQIERIVEEVSSYPIAGIKLTIEDGPSPPFVERMPVEFIEKTVREANRYGLEVYAHVSDNTELEMAIRSGVQNLVHYTGVNIDPMDSTHVELLNEFKTQDPGWVTTLMIDKSFLYPINPDWFENEAMLPEYKALVDNITPELIERAQIYNNILMQEYGLEESDLQAFVTPQVDDILYLYEEGFNMVLGTDTGNTFNFPGYSLHEEMQLLELGGMAPLDIIRMGTLNAATMMNAQDSLGSIENGKIANLVLLDKNPLESIRHTLSINSVIKNGIVQKRFD